MAEAWQADAWGFFDTCGLVKYAARFVGHAFSRVRLVPAVTMNPGDPPVPVDVATKDDRNPLPRPLADAAEALLARPASATDGQAGLQRAAGLNLFVAGECFLVGRAMPAGEDWSVRSVLEMRRRPDMTGPTAEGWVIRQPGSQGGDIELTRADYISRLWQPHPADARLADSSVRAILTDLAELAILDRMVRATATSRLSAGILRVPNEITIPRPTDMPDDPDLDPLLWALLQHMTAPIRDEGTASAVVPMMVRGPGEALAQLDRLDMARSVEDQFAAMRDEKRKTIAQGLDLPSEQILGKGGMNHWGAWQVDESTYKAHLEPLILGMCGQLTSCWLRPGLPAGPWADRLMVWPDTSDLVDHPDRGADAQAAYDRVELSGEALRRYRGFPESDAPSPEEVAARVARAAAMAGKPAPGEAPAAPPAVAPAAGPSTAQPPAVRTQSPASVQAGPPRVAALRAVPAATPGAAAAAALGRRLARYDRELAARIEMFADAALRRALERAGARLRSSAQRHAPLRAALAAVPRHRAAATVGRAVVAQLGFADDDDLLATDWDELAAHVDEQTDRTRDAALAAVLAAAAAAGRTPGDPTLAEWEMAALTDREAGHAALVAAMRDAAAHRLYTPDGDDDERLRDALDDPDTPLVAASAIRGVLSVYGGGGLPDETGAEMPGTGTGVATGARVLGLADTAGIRLVSWTWQHGAPAHPFKPHLDLDGHVFTRYDDAALALTSDYDWMDTATGGWHPGDHAGCTCSLEPNLELDTGAAEGAA
jgi:hypothetical protein